ncbi:MAG: PEP-CTERM sorting domain-containing protein [bacterium]|nr:PEP-CTERM sorting domain-containing protein [bacterium]
MTLKKWSLLAFAAALIAPMSASALGISIVNVSTSSPNADGSLENGDTITFDLLLENNDNLDIIGLDVGAFGYDEGAVGSPFDNHLQYDSARTGTSAFRAINGTVLTELSADVPQAEFGSALLFQERYVRLFGGISTTPTNGDGQFDTGIDGLLTENGDVHLQVTFSAQSLGATPGAPATVDLVFGIGQQGFDVQGTSGSLAGQWTNAAYTVTIVPEPGTALLMGLGLAGLAGARRR